ncbi:Soluble NSF attachment protein [Strongyloides ratti]|uniref:Soluble NSF attachment protein n=1 Tax=Strongyloides ratti TaxID=34506 RepID=A0A090LKR6_STRRB|nr:Soluble NSF attachment protein [Strongyloides ratti]CEF68743.1 Soluble NSF attachment protein [Strongyloides ratti]
MENEAAAKKKFEEAERKAKGGKSFFGLFGGGRNGEEACELYVQAGNLFKIAKNWHAAGDSFLSCAELHGKRTDGKHDSASNYAEAGNCYQKVDPQKAIDCFTKTADIYTDMGRFSMAAKEHFRMAELYDSDFPDKEKAMFHYEKAADFYKGEEAKSSATKCLNRVAQIAAELGHYRKAIEIFEEIAIWEADHSTLKYNAKNHFFQALLCHLCIDLLDSQQALKKYEDIHPALAESRECKLIKDIIASLEAQDIDGFTACVKNYDKISRLDKWHTALLLKIKKSCKEGEDDEEDLK